MTQSPSTPAQLIRTPVEVRWRDLDGFNHVNNATYFTYLEQARLLWLQQVRGTWFHEHAIPVMASCQAHFRRPLGWPACISVELTCERIGRSSLTIGHRIVDTSDSATCYNDGRVVIVWMDPATGKSVPLPDVIRAAATT